MTIESTEWRIHFEGRQIKKDLFEESSIVPFITDEEIVDIRDFWICVNTQAILSKFN